MKTALTSDSTWATSTSTTTSTTTTTTTSTTTSTTTTLRTTPHPYLPPSSSTHQPSLPQILSSPPPPSPLLLSTPQSTVQSSVQSSLHPSLVPFMTTPLPTPTTQPFPLPTFRSHQEISSSSSNSLPLLKPHQIIKEKERERAKIPTVMEDQEDEDEDEDEDEEEGSGEGSGEWTEMQGSGTRRSYHHHHHHQSWSQPLRTFRNFSNSTRTDLFKNKSQQTLTDTSNATKMKNVELPPPPPPHPPVSPLSPPSDKPPEIVERSEGQTKTKEGEALCCNPGQWQLFLIVSLVSILLTAVSILLTANKICLKYDVWLNQRRTRNVHRRQRRADYNHQRRLYDRAGEVLEMNILSRATVEPSDTSTSQQQEQQEPPAPDTSASQQEQQQQQPPPQHFKQLVGTFGWSLNYQIRKRSNNNVQVLLLLQFDFLLSCKKIFSNYSRRWESHKMRHRSSRLERGRRMAAAAAALAGVRQWTIWRKIMISSVWTIVSRMMGVSLPYVQMTTK